MAELKKGISARLAEPLLQRPVIFVTPKRRVKCTPANIAALRPRKKSTSVNRC